MSALVLLTACVGLLPVADETPLLRSVQLAPVDRGWRNEPWPPTCSPDGKLVATVAGTVVSVWDSVTGNPVARLHMPAEEDDALRMAFTADSRMLVTAGGRDQAVRWFEIRTGKQVREQNHPTPLDPVNTQPQYFRPAYVLGPGAEWLLTGESDGVGPIVGVIDLATGKRRASHKLYWYNNQRTLVTRDGLLVVNGRDSHLIEVWDVVAGKLLRTLPGLAHIRKGQRRPLGVSPDGKHLAIFEGDIPGPGGGSRVSVWGMDNGRFYCSLKVDYPHAAAFSADGLGLAVGTAMGVSVFDLRTESVYSALPVPERKGYRPASPDGKSLIILAANVGIGAAPETLYLTRFAELPSPMPAAGDLTETQVAEWWRALGSTNEIRRRYAVRGFVARPDQAVAEITNRLKPESAARQAMVADLLGVLDDDKFETREKAQAELAPLAHRFEPLLKAAAERAGPGEVRNRLTTLLAPDVQSNTSDFQTDLSAVAILEAVGTAEARKLLTDLAAGADGSRLTAEAKAALDRLKMAGR